MTYYLYIDVVFFINGIMDILILIVLKKILKLHTTAGKVVLAGILGALWACFIAVFPVFPRFLEGIFTYTVINGLMVKVAFSLKTFREICHAAAGFFLSALMLGGAIYSLLQYTRAGYYIEHLLSGNLINSLPLFILILLAAGSGYFCVYIWHTITSWCGHKNNLFQVTLYYQENCIKIVGLMDTGNRLYEPVTHKPVSIMTASAGRKLCQTVTNVCYIPYQSVGTKSGMLPAIYLDRIEIEQDGIVKEIMKPLVAFYSQELSPAGEYKILLHQELL